ncbi:MAG: class II aldolase/adducin family protein [Anaerolineae bacterium]|nr:class II aldolase/adducin family protein [Anaerolineae bacterium]
MTDYPVWNEWEMRHKIIDVGRRLYDLFFVAGNDGNISVRLNDDEILMTPTNVSKGQMEPEDIVKVSLSGQLLAASNGSRPSSEGRMHLAIYRNRPDIRAVVHAHPPTATGFAVANRDLTAPFLPEVVVRTGPTPLVPYTIPGGDELPASLIPYIEDHLTLLLGNHGVVAYGPTLRDALFNLETVELNARIFLTAHQLGQVQYLNEDQIEALNERYGKIEPQPVPAL